LFAQNEDFKNTISAHFGVSFFNFIKDDFTSKQTDSIKFSSAGLSNVPTLGIAWDYGVAKWFSVGIAGSYNQGKASVKDLEVFSKQTGKFEKIGDFAVTIPRTTLAARFLFHYGNAKRFDCYTGFRVGAGLWSVKIKGDIDEEALSTAIDGINKELGLPEAIPIDIPNKIKGRASFVLPQVQFIPFGIRGYVTENIGINGELAVGSPYFLSIGANYRF
jgi:hypothetical protein